jgi:hypothetical protein
VPPAEWRVALHEPPQLGGRAASRPEAAEDLPEQAVELCQLVWVVLAGNRSTPVMVIL